MKRFTNILTVVDTNHIGVSALNQASAIARKNGATLTVASVLEELPGEQWMSILAVTAEEIQDIAKTEELERLTEYLATFEDKGTPFGKRVLVGRGSAEIIRQVLRGKHDLLVKDAEITDGLLDMFLGSADMHLLRKCPCPVLISWPGVKHYKRILVCVDYAPGQAQNESLNRKIIEVASSLAQFESGDLHVIHAIEPFGEKFLRAAYIANKGMNFEELTEVEKRTRKIWLEKLLEQSSSEIEGGKKLTNTIIHLVKGHARDVVPETARKLNADLIIMGTLSRTGIPGYFIGNTSENILNQVRCSVLTLKPDGFVSPIKL